MHPRTLGMQPAGRREGGFTFCRPACAAAAAADGAGSRGRDGLSLVPREHGSCRVQRTDSSQQGCFQGLLIVQSGDTRGDYEEMGTGARAAVPLTPGSMETTPFHHQGVGARGKGEGLRGMGEGGTHVWLVPRSTPAAALSSFSSRTCMPSHDASATRKVRQRQGQQDSQPARQSQDWEAQ